MMPRTNRNQFAFKIPIILIGVLMLNATAIGGHGECPDLVIKSPDVQYPWHPFEASLVLTDQQKAVIRDVRWTITKHNTTSDKRSVESVSNSLSVTTKAWDANEAGYIQWLVVGRVGDCISAGTSSSVVAPNPGTPVLIDEFGELPINDVRGRLDSAIAAMKERGRSEELVIFAEFEPKVAWNARRLKISRMLDHMVGFRKFEANRLTFVLSEGTHTSFRLQPVLPQHLDDYTGNGTITIPAERFNDFVRFLK